MESASVSAGAGSQFQSAFELYPCTSSPGSGGQMTGAQRAGVSAVTAVP